MKHRVRISSHSCQDWAQQADNDNGCSPLVSVISQGGGEYHCHFPVLSGQAGCRLLPSSHNSPRLINHSPPTLHNKGVQNTCTLITKWSCALVMYTKFSSYSNSMEHPPLRGLVCWPLSSAMFCRSVSCRTSACGFYMRAALSLLGVLFLCLPHRDSPLTPPREKRAAGKVLLTREGAGNLGRRRLAQLGAAPVYSSLKCNKH